MAYTFLLGQTYVFTGSALPHTSVYTCRNAHRGCTPPFVFSIDGQVGFRTALAHVNSCHTRRCRQLKKLIIRGIAHKARWLFSHDALLGCVHLQPLLYGSRRIVFNRQRFAAVASHLARCPKDSCAQLRRALLLTIRNLINLDPVPAL